MTESSKLPYIPSVRTPATLCDYGRHVSHEGNALVLDNKSIGQAARQLRFNNEDK